MTDRTRQYIEMNGVAVGKNYIKCQPIVIERLLKRTGFTLEDIDLFVFHQANLRLIELLMSKLKLPMAKTFTNVETYGNTSDASVGLALCEAVEANQICRGDRVLLSGVGAGLVFAACVLKWY
ncbi:MAG: hypothetical protein HY351_00225 [Candidatus Omnitrophica bacterium]|nr:hypothetical protein [Candidatus Omnitrophota bacterium]